MFDCYVIAYKEKEYTKKTMASNLFKKTVRKTIQALKALDDMTSTSLLHLIQKNPERRSQREINLFLPTLMMKANCLQNVDRGNELL